MLGTTLLLAFRSIRRQLLRSFLTVLGVLFGFFPARRAAALNPIDALRRE